MLITVGPRKAKGMAATRHTWLCASPGLCASFLLGTLVMSWWEGVCRPQELAAGLGGGPPPTHAGGSAFSRTVGFTCWPTRRAVTGTGCTMTAAPQSP